MKGLSLGRGLGKHALRKGFVAEESLTATLGVADISHILSLSAHATIESVGSSDVSEILSLASTSTTIVNSTSSVEATAWNPSRLPSLQGWYLGSSGYGGGEWVDQSSIGNNLTLTGTSAGSTLNGYATVNFNGTTDKADKTSFSLGSSGSLSLFCVVKLNATILTQQSFSLYGDGLLDTHGVGSNVTGTSLAVNGVTTYLGSVSLVGGWHRIGTVDVSGGSQTTYVDGNVDSTGSNFGHIQDNLSLSVGHFPLAGLFGKMDIADLVICNAALSAPDLLKLDTYFTLKYNL